MICLQAFPSGSQVFVSSSDWFIVLFASVVIGQSEYFGFGFPSVLYISKLHGSLIQNWGRIGPIVPCMNNEVDLEQRPERILTGASSGGVPQNGCSARV